MIWERKVAKRFYSHTKNKNWYSGVLSMLGMSVGCFAMIISLSVMNGFEKLVHNKLKGFDGDLRILGSIKNIEEIKSIEHVTKVMPFMERKGLIEEIDNQKIVTFKAIDENIFSQFYDFNIRGSVLKSGEVIIGQDLAYRLGKDLGDIILLFSPLDQSFGFGIPYKKEFKIVGIFQTKVLDYDDRFVFLTLSDGNDLFRRKKSIDGLDIRINEHSNIKEAKAEVFKKTGDLFEVLSWKDLNKSLVSAMKIERVGTLCVLSLIFLVSTFNLATSLTLISYEKIKEIAILRSMGATKKSIIKIIVRCGFERAGRGAIFGLAMGIVFVLIQNTFSIIKIPSNIYFIDSLPMIISFSDFFVITFLSFSFIFSSSYLTGKRISKIKVIKALQWAK